jgi:hypothetical protein
MGPMALFDKSFLQSISADEAVWFDHFFLPIVCPVFYVETLGNLAKEATKRGPPEVIVRDIANKFPEWAGSPCAFHGDLVIRDLLGDQVGMRYQIPRTGGRAVKSGVVFDPSPEEEAFQRWRQGQFEEVERIAAGIWRKTLDELDLIAVQKEMRSIGFTPKVCKTLEDAKTIADALVDGTSNPHAQLALVIQFFHVPSYLHPRIAERWKTGRQPIRKFAPYAAYALTVEIFFQVALGAGLIGGERPSNRTDIAYLFYLPFSMVLISSDDLHRRAAPLFMRDDQAFVWGIDLKADLKKINAHFSQLPESERDKGISAFARSPPDGSMVADLWDRFMRKGIRDEQPVKLDPEADAALVARLKAFSQQPTLTNVEDGLHEEPEMMSIHRSVRHKRGSWWQLPKDYKEPPDEDTGARK